MKRFLKDISIILGVLLLFAVGLIAFTPYPATNFINSLFAKGGPAKEPADFQKRMDKIQNYNDLTYQSEQPQNKYDLVRPDTEEKVPVIIWVHGGAFVGGQKEDNRIYTQMLASEGYAVANMNYALAPGTKYPSPLIQLGELYQELEKQAATYNLDLSKVFFAGDSAGGQISMQFLAIQLDSDYSKKVGLPSVVPVDTIKGGLLFCTPFSLKDLSDLGDSKVIDYFVKNIGWAYTGDRYWLNSNKVKEADLISVVAKKMPPLFITDGNEFSFPVQGQSFAKKMREQGTDVTTVFYPESKEPLMHEYQFDMTLKASQETFEEVKEFIGKHK